MKKCGRCQVIKNDSEFSPSQLKISGGKCRSCNTEVCREYRSKNQDKIKKYQQDYDTKRYEENKEEILSIKKQYYQNNKEEILQDRKKYYQEHKEEIKIYNQQYYKENLSEEEKLIILEKDREYRFKNKDKIKKYHSEYYKKRRQTDPNFRIRTTISANINFYIKNNGSSKGGKSCLNYLPYSIDELKWYLESQFESWMNWNNYGKYNSKAWDDSDSTTWTWQIDHIIPQSILLYTSMEDENFRECWALKNIRPLSSKRNFLDGVKRIRH